jgi:predicted metal-dependent hydrolase
MGFKFEVVYSSGKQLYAKVTGDCRVIVTAPSGISREQIYDFVRNSRKKIERLLDEMDKRRAYFLAPSEDEIRMWRNGAKATLPKRALQLAAQTGLMPDAIKITSAKRSWGTLSRRRGKCTMCLSLYLYALPQDLIDCIIIHELCHIVQPNHSKSFYAEMDKRLPGWRVRKARIDLYSIAQRSNKS